MDNILPTAPRGDTPNHKLSNLGAWNPEKADGTNPNNIPYGLGVTTFDPAVDNRFVVNEPPVNEPNKRDLRPIYHAHDPSPLSAEMRGQAAVGKISLPDVNDDDSNPIYKPPRPKPESDEVILSIFNLSKSLMDTFIQRAGSIKSFGLKPRMQRQHNITAKASSKKEKDGFAQAKPVSILFGSPTQLSVVMSGRHEIRTVDFQPGPIGMEVEDVLNRLMCTRLLPDSQAEPHAYLVDAEIIAINGFRVITLDEFREEVTCSQRKGKVSIMCVCYRKSKTKIDGFYAQLVAQRKNVKSLFSGLLAGGLDSDHQHDISLTESDNKDDDEEEDSDEDEEEGGGAEAKAEGKEVDSLDEEAEEETDAKADAKESHARHSGRNGSKSMDDKDTKGFYDEEGDEREEEEEEEEEKKEAELSSDEDSDDDHEANTTSIRKKRVDYSHKMEKDGDEEEELMVIAKGHRNVPAAVDDMDSDLGFMDFAEEKEAVEEKGTDVIDEEQEGSEEDVDQVPIDNLALSPTTTVSEVLDTWDYATALDVEETVPFSRVVCVPPLFRKSIDWGSGQERYIQFTNYSDIWQVEVCWVDEEGAVVNRVRLVPGGTVKHMEFASPNHVWYLVASNHKDHEENHGHATEVPGYTPDKKATGMMIRPSRTSLLENKFTLITWRPNESVTATQNMRVRESERMVRPGIRPNAQEEILPNMVVTIMDGKREV